MPSEAEAIVFYSLPLPQPCKRLKEYQINAVLFFGVEFRFTFIDVISFTNT